jgi:hypothetical protein
MSVSQVIHLQATPGRFNDLLGRSEQLGKIRARLAPECETRRFVPTSGTVAETLIVVLEFPNARSLGEYQDKLREDSEARALQEKIRGDRDPIVISQTIEYVREL